MKKGFTLIELLVVIGIIMLLAGIMFPAFQAAREQARRAKAKADVKQLDAAFKAVLLDYRSWAAAGIGPSVAGVPADSSVVNYLSNLASGNPRHVIYMEFDQKSLDSARTFIDPWKQAYQVALGDDSVSPQGVGQPLGRQVAAWSWGRKGQGLAQVADYVKSWE